MLSCLLLSSSPPPPSRAEIACRFVRDGVRPAIRIQLNDTDYNGIGCNKRFFNAIHCGQWLGLLPDNQRNGRYSIGVVKDSCAEGQEDRDKVAENTTDDGLLAVITPNKQVLPIESNLRQQITEDRKCIPSIHDSTITKENEANAYNASQGSIPNLDMSNHGDPDGTNEYWTSSDSLAESTKAGVLGHEEKLINDFEIVHSMLDTLRVIRHTNLGQYSVLPKEKEPFSYKQIHSSHSNLDMANQGEVDKTNDSWTDTNSFAESTEVDFVDGKEKLIDVLEFEQSMPDDLGGTIQTNLDQYSIITKKKESDSYDQNHRPHSDLGTNSNRELNRLHDSWTSSDSFAQSTKAVVVDEELTNYLEVEKSIVDSLEQLSQNNYEQSQSVLSYLSDMPHSSVLMDNNLEISTEVNTQGTCDHSEVPLDEGNLQPSPLAGSNVMNVIVVAAECAPWSKTGGLGDVVGDLPKALARRGHRVMVVAPKYGNYAEAKEVGLLKRYKAIGQDLEVIYYHAYIDSVDFVFIDCPVFRHIENNIYGGNRQDILKRMVLLCKAAVEVPWYVPCGGSCYGDGNLVFIANDWHTSLLPVYLKAYYRDNGVMIYVRSVLVIHNIAHQGRGPVDEFSYLDLPDHYIDRFKLYDPVGGEHLNILAAGLKSADRVITVSHGYAWELRTTEGGWGLHSIINEIGFKFHGIVNGIDEKNWNPKFDVHLTSDGYTNYDVESVQVGKAQCKAALQRELNLPIRSDVPIVAFIGRLDGQKGVDLIIEAKHWLVGQDLQLIMLGTGRGDLEDMLRSFEGEHRNKVRGWVGFSDKLAHRITAGADILLMPSRFEPCGLNQLYAMMYGTVPVVHSVGGLRDTVQQFDPFNETGLGWTFDQAQTHKMIEALNHCLRTYRYHKESWEGLQVRGMIQDLSWDNAAKRYEEVLVAAKYQW